MEDICVDTADEDLKASKNSNKDIIPVAQKCTKNGTNSVILTTARPATVISNSNAKERFLSKEER